MFPVGDPAIMQRLGMVFVSKVTFDEQAMRQARMHEANPSLGVIQYKAPARACEDGEQCWVRDPEAVSIGEAFAQREALALHRRLCPSNLNFTKHSKIFFQSGSKARDPGDRSFYKIKSCLRQDGSVLTSFDSKRVFILDSGASFHLIQRAHLTPSEKKTIRKLRTGYLLNTANGEVFAEEEVDVYVEDLDVQITALILDCLLYTSPSPRD